jgi:ABC-type antimicrobial peptide transport system permease subunit
MNNPVFIKFSWIALILSIPVYYMIGRHFPGDNYPVLSNGATWYDLASFNGIQVFMFLLSLGFSCMMIYITDMIELLTLNILKYFVFTITGILFIRMCFHFVLYEKIINLELSVYLLLIIAITLRFFYTHNKWQYQ